MEGRPEARHRGLRPGRHVAGGPRVPRGHRAALPRDPRRRPRDGHGRRRRGAGVRVVDAAERGEAAVLPRGGAAADAPPGDRSSLRGRRRTRAGLGKPAMQVAKCRFGLRQYDQRSRPARPRSSRTRRSSGGRRGAPGERSRRRRGQGRQRQGHRRGAPEAGRRDDPGFTADPAEWHDAFSSSRSGPRTCSRTSWRLRRGSSALLAEARQGRRDGEATRDDVMAPL